MKNHKKILNIVMVAAVLSLIAAGSTLAYLSAYAGTAVNKINFAAPITATLTEPLWVKYGEELAKTAYPGLTIPKDPTVTNTSNKGLSEWVGVTVTFTDNSGDPLTTGADSEMSTLLSEITVAFNPGWVDAAGADPSAVSPLNENTNTYTFYYNAVLAPPVPPATSGESATLFHAVTFLNNGNSDSVLAAIRQFGGGGFQIDVQSGGVQGSASAVLTSAVEQLIDGAIPASGSGS